MSRRRNIKTEEERTDINISPMIDMVFILLIFFIVTTVFVEERGIEAEKPQPGKTDPNKDNQPIKIHVAGTGQILFNGDEIGLATIRTHVGDRLREAPDVPVIVEVEQAVTAGRMEQVIDQARLGGAPKVSVTQAVQKSSR